MFKQQYPLSKFTLTAGSIAVLAACSLGPATALAARSLTQPDGISASRPPTIKAKSEGDRLVTPSIIFETQTLQPGTVVNMGISYTIEPKWHMYWNGQNDSGFAPEIELQLPEGFEALPTQWPAPKRYVAEGDITDHIYEGQVTLIVPVRVPQDAKVGTQVNFGLTSKWLVCFDRCIPGSGEATAKMMVQAQKADKSKDSELIAASLRAMPVAFDPAKHEVEVEVLGDRLVIKPKSDVAKDIESLAFFPAEKWRSLVDIASDGVSTRSADNPPVLDAKLSKVAANIDPAARPKVSGIIEVKGKQGIKWYWFEEKAPVNK